MLQDGSLLQHWSLSHAASKSVVLIHSQPLTNWQQLLADQLKSYAQFKSRDERANTLNSIPPAFCLILQRCLPMKKASSRLFCYPKSGSYGAQGDCGSYGGRGIAICMKILFFKFKTDHQCIIFSCIYSYYSNSIRTPVQLIQIISKVSYGIPIQAINNASTFACYNLGDNRDSWYADQLQRSTSAYFTLNNIHAIPKQVSESE